MRIKIRIYTLSILLILGLAVSIHHYREIYKAAGVLLNIQVHSGFGMPGIRTIKDWSGRWEGPEGTYLLLNPKSRLTYEIVITDLDAQRSFLGVIGAYGVHFNRYGQQEVITATDGEGTGMKWLAGKETCLVIRTGEGFCRD